MQQFVLFAVITLLAMAVWIIDRRKIRDYLLLSFFTLLLAYVFETLSTFAGFWHYYAGPMIPLVSIYTWLMYAPYLSICYFIGNKFARGRSG